MNFLEKIFSIKNDNNHKSIRFLGFKFKFKNKIALLENTCNNLESKLKKLEEKHIALDEQYKQISLSHTSLSDKFYRECSWYNYFTAYKYSGISPQLINELEFLNQSKLTWKNLQHQLWLCYMSILLDIEDEETAKIVLDRYLFWHKDKDIHLFLNVANFAHKKWGVTNEKIKKASLVFEKLNQNHKNGVFENLIKDKSIAMVGNGAFEVGLKKGNEINSKDLVFRFNVYNLDGFEEDYGTKTDVWVQFPTNPKLLNYKTPEDIQLLLYRIDCWFIENDDALEIMYQNLDKNIDYIDFCSMRNMHKDNFMHNPTTGGILISWMNSLLEDSMKNVKFYGFKFCAENKDAAHHYYDDEKVNTLKDHDFDYEGKYLNKILNGRI